jgi:hypothetical protein
MRDPGSFPASALNIGTTIRAQGKPSKRFAPTWFASAGTKRRGCQSGTETIFPKATVGKRLQSHIRFRP